MPLGRVAGGARAPGAVVGELQDAGPADVDDAVGAREDDLQRCLVVGDGEVQVAGQQVPRAERQQAHGLAGADHRLGHRPHGPVPADGHDDVGPALEGLAGLAAARVLDGRLEPERRGQVRVGARLADHGLEAGDVLLGGVGDERVEEARRRLVLGLVDVEGPLEPSHACHMGPDRQGDDERERRDDDRADPQPQFPGHEAHRSRAGRRRRPCAGASGGRCRYPSGVIDLRLLRDDPDVVRASQAARGDDPALVDAVLAADARRRTALTEFERCAPSRRPSASRSPRRRATRSTALLARAKELAEQVKALQSRRRRRRGVAHRAELCRSRTSSRRASPPAARTTTSCSSTSATVRDFAAEGFAPRDHLELGEGLRRHRHGARREGVRRALLLPDRRRRAARARAAQPGRWTRRWPPASRP